ncbi:MAG TPA: zinc ribbon domain-containing protein [Bacillota bacterium]|nr:zinc ribbon domain-containing protein [Bacillota bacterium]
MFCQKCGSPLREGDKSCKICGAEISGAGICVMPVGSSIFEVQTKTVSNETEEVTRAAEAEEAIAIKEAPETTETKETEETEKEDAQFNWNLEGFPKPQRTEAVNFDWSIEETDDSKESIMKDEKLEEAGRIEGSEDPIDPMEELNRYFKFDKASEDFQKLLDREYERMKEFSQPFSNYPYIEKMAQQDRADKIYENMDSTRTEAEYIPDREIDEKEIGEELNSQPENSVRIAAVEVFPEAEENEEDEPEVIWVEEKPLKAPEGQQEHEETSQPDPDDIFKPGAEALPQQELIFGYGIETNTEPATEPSELNGTGFQGSVDDLWEDDETESGYGSGYGSGKKLRDHELRLMRGTEDSSKETTTNEKTPNQEPANETPTNEETPNQEPVIDDHLKEDTEKEDPLWFEIGEEEAEEERKGGGCVGRAILIIIIAILAAEAAILGLQYFLPESKAAVKAAEINGAVSGTLVEWREKVQGFLGIIGGDKEAGPGEAVPEDTEDPAEAEEPDPTPGTGEDTGQPSGDGPDTVPMADKGALITAVSDNNKNIVTVKGNDDLCWKPNKEYAISDINNSKPIENNYWFTDKGGEHVYYDREIAAALISFDSMWIDYINEGSKAVLDITKKGSKAYKNVSSFSKVGKVKQSFLTLEIGEIRQGKDAFYVWTYEEIKEVQGNTSTVKKYNWIYRLEPVDEEMKIVNYYKY